MSTSTDRLSIRPATPDDAALIHRFICDLADYEKLRHEVKATPDMLAHWLFGPTPRCEAVIGEIGGTPRGFALFFHNFSTFEARPGLYLEDLYVDPDVRGFGLGKALLCHLARLAIDRDCARFEWSVLDWNEPAINFYRSLGAVAMDEWTINRVDGAALIALANGG